MSIKLALGLFMGSILMNSSSNGGGPLQGSGFFRGAIGFRVRAQVVLLSLAGFRT